MGAKQRDGQALTLEAGGEEGAGGVTAVCLVVDGRVNR